MTLSPQGVAYEIVSGGDAERTTEGLVPHEVRFWDTAAQQRGGLGKHRITAADGDRPTDLMNSFLMQIREQHQRIVTRPTDGYLLHSDQSRGNIWVPPEVVVDTDDLGAFLKARNLPLGGYEPFRFPSYAGVEESLNGMWQHERYTVPLLGQVEANIERYITVAKREGWGGDRRGTTINLQVGSGADDAWEFDDSTGFDGTSNLVMCTAQADANIRRNGGIRFLDVTAAGVINAAVIQVSPFSGSFDDALIDILAEDVDDAVNFLTDARVTGRTRTTAAVNWSADSLGTGFVTSPDITTVVQEIIDRGDRVSGSAVVILCDGVVASIKQLWFWAYEGDSAAAAKLDITFTAPSAGGASLPPGWGGPAAPPRGTGPPGGAASGAPLGTAPIYGGIDVAVRARQLADAVCDGVTVRARGQQSVAFSLVQLLHCLQGRGVPHAPQSVEASLNAIFVELGITRRANVTLAQELDTIAAHLP